MTQDNPLVHATLVEQSSRGALLIGSSGSGKSDLALRFIHQSALEGAGHLVADDQVELYLNDKRVWGRAPLTLKGQIEVRQLGICEVPSIEASEINLVVNLKSDGAIERLPTKDLNYNLLGQSIPMIELAPFEASAPIKLSLALKNS